MAVLALKDRLSKLLCGHVVPNKGASAEWVISQANRDLQKMGHSNSVTLRSDGEPALVDLLNKIAEKRPGIWQCWSGLLACCVQGQLHGIWCRLPRCL